MSKQPTTPTTDPAAIAHQKLVKLSAERAARAIRKRRRKKSHQ